jgi:hypothetical protein
MASMTTERAPIDPQTSTDVPALMKIAFQRINAREFDAARPVVDRLCALDPDNGMTAHARMHLETDSCEVEAGAAFGEAFLARHDPAEGINVHNAWHLAALQVEAGQSTAALGWHQRVVTPAVAPVPMTFASAVTLLWRIELYGLGRARGATLPWEAMHAAGRGFADAAPLNEISRAMTCIAIGDAPGLESLLERLGRATAADAPGIAGAADEDGGAELALPIVLGLRAAWEGDAGGAVERLEAPVRDLRRLSSFQEQRTPIEDTLLASRLRAGSNAAAAAFLRQRTAAQPRPLPRDLYWLGQAEIGAGERQAGIASLRAARERWHSAEPDSPEIVALDALLAA